MNKYEQQQEELKIHWEVEEKKFTAEANRISGLSTQYCNKFNSFVTIINVERHLMRKEINTLYKFLKVLGDIQDKATLFDFAAEDWLFSEYHSNGGNGPKTNSNPLDFTSRAFVESVAIGAAISGSSVASATMAATATSGIIGATAAVGLVMPVIVPVAIPAYVLFKGMQDKANDKQRLEDMTKRFEAQKIQWKKELSQMHDEGIFFANAVMIADMYRILIAQVRDTITERIIPEFNCILSFLYADAIKNSIINNDSPDEPEIASINEYRGTPYESHYIFVKNTFDYYLLINNFFKEPVLSNLLSKRKLTKIEYDQFQNKLKLIGNQQVKLLKDTTFGGEVK